MTQLTLEQIEKAVVKITEILNHAHGYYDLPCVGDFDRAKCLNCDSKFDCEQGGELERLTQELTEIIEEE